MSRRRLPRQGEPEELRDAEPRVAAANRGGAIGGGAIDGGTIGGGAIERAEWRPEQPGAARGVRQLAARLIPKPGFLQKRIKKNPFSATLFQATLPQKIKCVKTAI